MSRYIDADALIPKMNECVNDHYITDFDAIATILDAPSIDIVRCKECKHYKQSEAFCENGNGLWQAGDECFCSYGEREGE